MDLVRDLLFYFEEKPGTEMVRGEDIKVDGRDDITVNHHLTLMYQAGLLTAETVVSSTTSERIIYVIPFELTWKGHEFLETVRDPEIWRRAKANGKAAGTASIEFIWSIAKALILTGVKEKTGLDLA
jgi:hypothetical protein